MEISEGEIYEGGVSPSGDDGPIRRWIVISPFGKTHAHSIDNPLDTHCLPLGAAIKGITDGKLKRIDTQIDHPILQLQRIKETLGIRDTHLGIHGKSLDRMLELLEQAVNSGANYAPYVAGEIFRLVNKVFYTTDEVEAMRQRIEQLLAQWHPPVLTQ